MRITQTPLALAFYFLLVSSAQATEQEDDILVLGNCEYAIKQSPMAQFWHLELEPPRGRLRKPQFDVIRSSNWRGYSVKWTIENDKLLLAEIHASIEGKPVKNEQIINKPFPLPVSPLLSTPELLSDVS